eukprot:CAMPEP_0184347786 /NCGR_PEP_ID=MMETSP1089-20130417/22356_1 /TAXON_ID=38269 ORGANISM="Gloeochaete wittrockiana, Strain SAG46.84" /NCGR_SAMPLE_ID=MMETSP1089 /ASSEMBLY_ACC=CAM_ASM_000445 /LENGTH=331 /DNA_ID=CAMNT_0026679099 /DNA_START=35 /DNA_END=1030 /DNA_ORIENTATION=+
MPDTLQLRGLLKGHSGWVSSIATSTEGSETQVVTGSRDKTIIVWRLGQVDEYLAGVPVKVLEGHDHFVQEVALSSDGQYALSCSWDKTMRLWDINERKCIRLFNGHTDDILSVAFSRDNRFILSGSRDKSVRLWNTIGKCQLSIGPEYPHGHSDWVSCVKFSPVADSNIAISASWDKTIKVWNITSRDSLLKAELKGHTEYVNAVAVAPDGSLCASGGKDGQALLWDLNKDTKLYSLEAGGIINALAFSPNRYWLVAATNNGIKVWDLESKQILASLDISNTPNFFGESSKQAPNLPPEPACVSLAWSQDGATLFAGYTDNLVRVWSVVSA